MKMHRMMLRVGLAAVALGMASGAQATNIDTSLGALGSGENLSAFSFPETATYGQTFTVGAGDTLLTNFSMYLSVGQLNINFRSYIATWDGNNAVSLLYTSPIATAIGTGIVPQSLTYSEFGFSPGIAVTPGQKYVAFFSVTGLPQNTTGRAMPIGKNLLIGGESVFDNNSPYNFEQLFTSAWDIGSNNGYSMVYDTAFKASFTGSGSGAVPEPTTWALMIAGFGLTGAVLRRGQRQAHARLI